MQSKLMLTLMFIAYIFFTPLSVIFAEQSATTSNLLITELQTAGANTGTSKNEFFELYNPLDADINIGGWKAVYTNSSGNSTDIIIFEDALILSKAFAIAKNSDASEDFMQGVTADFTYSFGSSGLAASSGTLSIYNDKDELVDYIQWTSAASSDDVDVVTGLSGGMSAQLSCDNQGTLLNNVNKSLNYIIAEPSPLDIPCVGIVIDDDPQEIPDEPDPSIIENPSVETEQLDIDINELFVDPSSPQTDTNDEFIELYNPNPVPADISGYQLESGTTTIYKHTFAAGTVLPPLGYYTLYSKDTTLSLTNSGGRVSLYGFDGVELETIIYPEAKQGESWSKNIIGVWEWTTTVTPNSENIISKPVIIQQVNNKKSTKSTTTKKTVSNTTLAPPIQLNEIYPDPISPQKDSEDEYVELYNPYPYSINIADYTIITGTEKQYKYTFPIGSIIEGFGYLTVTSKDTNLTLNNSNGRVLLINNFSQEIDRTEYDSVKTGLSWARDDRGTWVWTTEVTKNFKNIINLTSVTNSAAKTIVSGAQVIGTEDTPLVPAPQPLPNWLLAILGACGVCYAAYEYRFEIRNKLYKLRAN